MVNNSKNSNSHVDDDNDDDNNDDLVMNKILGYLADSESIRESHDNKDETDRMDRNAAPKENDENVQQDMMDLITKNQNQNDRNDIQMEYDFWKMNTTWLLTNMNSKKDKECDDGSMACEICDNVIWNETYFEKLKMEVISSDFYQTKLCHGRTQGGINTTRRNDKATFLPHYSKIRNPYPLLSNFIHSVESTIVQNLSSSSNHSSYFTFDLSRTSVQLATYSPNSHGYVRHHDNNIKNSSNNHHQEEVGRRITAVYYLTDKSWNESHGGQLRLFYSPNKYYDAVPKANRLVLFRSEFVEHQVLPLSSITPGNRIAITIWIYGIPNKIQPLPQPQRILLPQPLPKSCQALPTLDDHTIVNKDDRDLIVKGSIFVMIASYCDSETIPTIQSLISNAQYPQRIHVGIVWQNDNTTSIPEINGWKNCRCIQLPARDATGPMYARTLGQQLYRNETFYVQIDSHMRFRPNWDTYSLQLLLQQQPQQQTNKTILTTYPPSYTLNNTDTSWMDETRGTTLIPWKFDENGILRQKGIISDQKIHKHYLYAAGFHISYAMPLLQECPYIPLHHLFFGEELFMSCRLYTHGYTTVSPPTTIAYHLWSRNHRPNPHPVTTNIQEKENNRKLVLEMVSNPNHPLLGSQRSLSDYASAINVNFQTQSCINSNEDVPISARNDNDGDESILPMQNLLLKIIDAQQTMSS